MTTKTRPFDPAKYLDTSEAIAAYLEDAFATSDAAEIADAIGVVARAKGMSDIAKEAGLSRESLYRALSKEGNPSFDTVMRILSALDLQIEVKSKQAA
jgi:probable addiction module antidote protein